MSIKVRIIPNKLGHLQLIPVAKKVCERIALSNNYDGSFDSYLQCDQSIAEVMRSLTYAQRKEINKGFSATILMDEWNYRHKFVGGQSVNP